MSRQVQWRRFTFFDKETITEDIVTELGAEVSCMHTAGGRLYLGGFDFVVVCALRGAKVDIGKLCFHLTASNRDDEGNFLNIRHAADTPREIGERDRRERPEKRDMS